jgi:predicted DNA-binding protein YlxM (UPF0122 family)
MVGPFLCPKYLTINRRYGIIHHTLKKTEEKIMTYELTLKLTADQINRLVDALLDSLPAEPENREILDEVHRVLDSQFASLS